MINQGISTLLITPGADLRYLTGYHAKPLERLTCLVLPAEGEPSLVLPALELQAAQAAGVDIELLSWGETEDPFALVSGLVGPGEIAVDQQMWAERTLELQRRLPDRPMTLAGSVINELRMRKDRSEVDALRTAGSAIDRVHARMGEWLRAGRTEREVGADIAQAILDEGHERVDFVIVGSGPNGSSPHHEVSDRVINPGEPVVVDIGGTTAEGYCSDCTRNYIVEQPAPMEYQRAFAALRQAQQAQLDFARPGVSAAQIDAVGREALAESGLAQLFIHRTGHGIGQQTHEEPYIVAGSQLVIEPGMAFSIEPGCYLPDAWGARIEDIVVCTDDGIEILNNQPRELRTL